MFDELYDAIEAFHSGTNYRAFSFLGCHPESRNHVSGYVFRVWSPNALSIHLVGNFNQWNPDSLPLSRISESIWEIWSNIPQENDSYKFLITSQAGSRIYKSDPFAFRTNVMPDTSSRIFSESYSWQDEKWMRFNRERNPSSLPMNIYEVHLGSWRRKDDGSYYSYRELTSTLPSYVKDMGYTHVEFLPLTEYPHDPSWGYQVTGYFSPTSRYGTPSELKQLIDAFHSAGIGVILDWVPAHFPKDGHGLCDFDGSCVFELSDPLMKEHPDWGTRIFDFGKPEVRSFLISSAVYWLKEFHFDGIRVDAVSSMLYLDYNRPNYRPNKLGGKENLEAIAFLRQLNLTCSGVRQGIIMAAEESTAFPYITKAQTENGLGFHFKWNMGWMNDTLQYVQEDPLFRKHKHHLLTFPMVYAFSENHILPLSHDEVVHGKKSLLSKMPCDYFWKFAGLRSLFAYQIMHPGKKLNFMGSEFGQFIEWDFGKELDWMLLNFEMHKKMHLFVRELNHFYLDHSELWENDQSWDGYQWIEPDEADLSIIAFRRINLLKQELICICNFTPVLRENYYLGVPTQGVYSLLFTSDSEKYGGTGSVIPDAVSEKKTYREYKYAAPFTLPPLSVSIFSVKAETTT